jgi:hypothetical protein
MAFVVLVHATFDTQADAQAAYDSIRTLASKSKRAWVGQAGERTSWGGVYEEQADGSLSELGAWFVDDGEFVKEGKPLKGGTKLTPLNTPAWDVTKTYPLNYDVAHINKFWRSQIAGNIGSAPDKANTDWVKVTTV